MDGTMPEEKDLQKDVAARTAGQSPPKASRQSKTLETGHVCRPDIFFEMLSDAATEWPPLC
jgi:hypothetical protein